MSDKTISREFDEWGVCQRDWDDAHLINAALDIHADDPGYGYRFIADELAEHGIAASENRVWRLCSLHGSSRCTPRSVASTASLDRQCTTTC